MLNNWFAFAPILNMAVLGIFALINISWVISNWKQTPSEKDTNDPSLGIRINN